MIKHSVAKWPSLVKRDRRCIFLINNFSQSNLSYQTRMLETYTISNIHLYSHLFKVTLATMMKRSISTSPDV